MLQFLVIVIVAGDCSLIMSTVSLNRPFFTTVSGKVEDVSKVQTLLFSATMPNWVKQVGFLTVLNVAL